MSDSSSKYMDYAVLLVGGYLAWAFVVKPALEGKKDEGFVTNAGNAVFGEDNLNLIGKTIADAIRGTGTIFNISQGNLPNDVKQAAADTLAQNANAAANAGRNVLTAITNPIQQAMYVQNVLANPPAQATGSAIAVIQRGSSAPIQPAVIFPANVSTGTINQFGTAVNVKPASFGSSPIAPAGKQVVGASTTGGVTKYTYR